SGAGGATRPPGGRPSVGAHVFALQLQALPGPDALSGLLQAQRVYPAQKTGWRPLPAESLHLTVQPILDPVEIRQAQVIQPGAAMSMLAGLGPICSESPAFEIVLDRVTRLRSAIVALGETPAPLAALRRRLVHELIGLRLPVRTLEIAHVTLFRCDLGEGPAPAAPPSMPIKVRMRVGALRLIEEKVFPSLEVEILRTFELGGAC
ncbi:MAG: 2'-5' RNA ligase family protein, partial [Alphaproteobacteria bacterium]